jgi:hypothetical protein
MVIAAHHPEAQRNRARQHVEERFFLDRISLERADVAERDLELAALIVTNLTNSNATLSDDTAMPARVALELFVRVSRCLTQFRRGLTSELCEGVGKG